MKSLSKESEARLMDAVRNVVERVSGGLSPTDAVAKVAADMQIPRGHVQLMCNAYNTGVVNSQRKEAGSILDRFADVPLADAKVAVDKMFPETISTPAEQLSKTAVHDDYGVTPRWIHEPSRLKLQRMSMGEQFTKAASVAAPKEKTWAEKYEALKARRKEADSSRTKAAAARDVFLTSIDNLVGYFKKRSDYRLSRQEVRDNVVATYGDVGDKLMQSVDSRLDRIYKKEAAVYHRHYKPVDWLQEPYSLVKTCVDSAEVMLKEQQVRLDKEEAVKIAADAPGMAKESPAVHTALHSIFGGPTGSAVAGLLGKFQPKSELVENKVTALNDPEHESDLSGIQTEAVLHDAMMNDDVIKGYEPEQIIAAYNEVAQLAPHVVQHPAALRPLLRRQLQSNVQPHEIDQTLGLESSLRKMHGLPATGKKD